MRLKDEVRRKDMIGVEVGVRVRGRVEMIVNDEWTLEGDTDHLHLEVPEKVRVHSDVMCSTQ